jgi:CrcB protein
VLLKSILAVSIGAALGALLRWVLSEWLNAAFPAIPPGTLLSNLIGGYLVGIAIAVFATSSLPLEWRLFVITGFCGGLTTFSTFSAELVIQLQQGRALWAAAAAGAHLVGSVAMTIAGIGTVFFARKLGG